MGNNYLRQKPEGMAQYQLFADYCSFSGEEAHSEDIVLKPTSFSDLEATLREEHNPLPSDAIVCVLEAQTEEAYSLVKGLNGGSFDYSQLGDDGAATGTTFNIPVIVSYASQEEAKEKSEQKEYLQVA